MKFIIIGLLCLLCAVALADDSEDPTDKFDDDEDDIPDTDVNDPSQPWPISYNYVADPYVLLITKKLNWFEATAACANRDFSLVSIDSFTKQRTLFNVILGSGFQSQMNEPVWTSGSNLANRAVWSWYSTGKALSYRNFQNQKVTTEYRCLAFNTVTGYWVPELCSAKRYFICECTG